ncbi:MAG: DEAD/DEAH box helicase, partial [Rectinemataceae bacterium]
TLTSYETFQRDQKKLEDREWDLVVLDEAHLIKNPDTKRSKALKLVKSSRRLALSGTPVENHLGELWSIFDFVLPGYLRTLDRFARDYRKPIEVEKSAEQVARLRCITAPFLMRRLKVDKSIIADLPDKIVTDEYANLTPEQAALYESVVRDYMAKIEESEGIARRGLILALITALKQVCNHPRNYDKESDPISERSGKARLLAAILDVAMEAGEKVIVFSQYVEMLEILRTVIEHDLGVEPFILHGGLTKTKRDAAIDGFKAFQGPGVFLISLKAGGLGLNLTEATRVIHYDLWFNPAVENQATDRAFRIGQRKNVFVHRLITKDSFEEKINATLLAKRELADLAVSAGETWLTELGNAELAALVKR